MRTLSIFILFVFGVGWAVASEETPRPENDESETTQEWDSLKDLGSVQTDIADAGETVTRESMIAGYLARADNLGDFRDRGAPGGDAAEARRLQALALLFAAWSGDTSRSEERSQLVTEVRADEDLAPELRNEVAAYAENLKVSRAEFATRTARLLAFEEKARLLQAEFPSVPDNYEALLQLAKSQDDANGERIVDDLLGLPAPDWITTDAATLKRRYGLIGQNLSELVTLPAVLQEAIDPAEDRPVLMYTWSVASKASIAVAKALGASVKLEAALVGINLDTDAGIADLAAAAASLPGDQLYADAAGYEAVIVALALSEPGLIYEVDDAGLIISVSARSRIKQSSREEQPLIQP